MKTRTGRHHPRAVAAFLLAALFSTTGLTAAASPAAEPAAVIQTEATAAADRYVSMAIYLPTFAWHATWASTASEAQTKALEQCNVNYSYGTYNCSSAGYAVNAYLAVAVSTHNGPWGPTQPPQRPMREREPSPGAGTTAVRTPATSSSTGTPAKSRQTSHLQAGKRQHRWHAAASRSGNEVAGPVAVEECNEGIQRPPVAGEPGIPTLALSVTTSMSRPRSLSVCTRTPRDSPRAR